MNKDPNPTTDLCGVDCKLTQSKLTLHGKFVEPMTHRLPLPGTNGMFTASAQMQWYYQPVPMPTIDVKINIDLPIPTCDATRTCSD